MFKDTKEELERLEAELLEDEEDIEKTEETEDQDVLLEEIIEQVKAEGAADMDATQVFGTPVDATRRIPRMEATQKISPPSKIYNSDRTDEDLQDYSDQICEDPRKDSCTGLVVTAALLSAGILAVVIWWIVRYWGVL